jgi:hypothetical protein
VNIKFWFFSRFALYLCVIIKKFPREETDYHVPLVTDQMALAQTSNVAGVENQHIEFGSLYFQGFLWRTTCFQVGGISSQST